MEGSHSQPMELDAVSYKGKGKSKDKGKQKSKALAKSTWGSSSLQSGGAFAGNCLRCGVYGHKASECQQQTSEEQLEDWGLQCWRCWGYGHRAHQCANLRSQPELWAMEGRTEALRQATIDAAAVPVPSDDDELVANSKASVSLVLGQADLPSVEQDDLLQCENRDLVVRDVFEDPAWLFMLEEPSSVFRNKNADGCSGQDDEQNRVIGCSGQDDEQNRVVGSSGLGDDGERCVDGEMPAVVDRADDNLDISAVEGCES